MRTINTALVITTLFTVGCARVIEDGDSIEDTAPLTKPTPLPDHEDPILDDTATYDTGDQVAEDEPPYYLVGYMGIYGYNEGEDPLLRGRNAGAGYFAMTLDTQEFMVWDAHLYDASNREKKRNIFEGRVDDLILDPNQEGAFYVTSREQRITNGMWDIYVLGKPDLDHRPDLVDNPNVP